MDANPAEVDLIEVAHRVPRTVPMSYSPAPPLVTNCLQSLSFATCWLPTFATSKVSNSIPGCRLRRCGSRPICAGSFVRPQSFRERGVQVTALPCRRRPGRVPCPGRVHVERQDLPSRILWQCPACDEAGVIDGWQGSVDDLSALSESSEGGHRVQVVIPEKAYQLLLDEIPLGQGCERLLYRARSHLEGVEISGNEDDFEQLIGVVAFNADRSGTRARQRRWRAIDSCLRPRSLNWLERSTDVVIDELASFGLVSLRAHVTELIRDRLATVMEALDITEQSARRYLEEEDLRELAARRP